MAAEQSKDRVKICDQLEKPIERLKVNEVWHQTVLKGISISWIRTLGLPLVSVDASSNMRHTHRHANTQTHTETHTVRNVVCSGVAYTHTRTAISTHCNP